VAHALCVGVAGGTGSGKTTIAQAIIERVGRRRILELSQDRYYRDLSHLPLSDRAQRNFDHPRSFESARLADDLRRLKEGHAADLPVYDFTRHVRLPETVRVESRAVIVLDGILILALPEIRDLIDVKIFVDADADLRFIRRLARDMTERGRTLESVVDQYLDSVRPMHLEFVEPSKRWADVIIPEGGFNAVALDMVVSRVEAALRLSRDRHGADEVG
jgi:uridine kinase